MTPEQHEKWEALQKAFRALKVTAPEKVIIETAERFRLKRMGAL